MRIAMIQKKKRWSGQPHHIYSLALGLKRRGHQIHVLCAPGSEFLRHAASSGISAHELALESDHPLASFPMQIIAAVRLARFLRRNRIELLHCHDSRDHLIGAYASALTGVPMIRTKHNTLALRNRGSRFLYSRRTSHVIAVSEAVRKALIDDQVPPDHVSTVYNSIDSERFSPGPPDPALRRSLLIPEDALVVGTVGRLHRAKGIADLVEAMPTIVEVFPETRFLLVGGSYLWWPPRVKELGLEDRVLFTGRIPNVIDYLRLMDVAVFPTLREAFGLSILEAASARRPVVATRVGGVPELIQHETTGLLVEPHRPALIAAAVIRLLRNRDLAHRLATESYKVATEVFTEEHTLEGTERVYALALGRAGART